MIKLELCLHQDKKLIKEFYVYNVWLKWKQNKNMIMLQ
jgi:hypothetical protein